MSGSSALDVANVGYWSFLDALVETEPVRKVRLRRSRGDALIAEFKRCPIIGFGSFEIDFLADDWDLSGITSLNVSASSLRFRFGCGPMTDELKLYVITSVIWRRAKVQTIKQKYLTLAMAVERLGLAPENVRLLSAERVSAYLSAIRPNLAPSTLGSHSSNLRDLLEFHERLFGRMTDPDVIPLLAQTTSQCRAIASGMEGYPCIPPEYAEALLDVAERVMRDGGEDPDDVITAAAIVILYELGFRAGELLGLEFGAIEVVKGAAGLPDIAYLTFKTYKGERGDGAYRLRRTVMSAKALGAYLLLEKVCEKRRRALGVPTLIVYPRQRVAFCSVSILNSHIRRFLVRHAPDLPCVNSSASFPELPTMSVADATAHRGLAGRLGELGLEPEDELVYVTSHMFRVSLATRLYEAGYDLAVIASFMNHISPNTTVGYVRSEREMGREMSDAVYRALLVDGAELLGPHGEEFSALVGDYAASLKGTVHGSDDELIAACSERYPLRLKPGYVCTKCGSVRGCPSDSGTDEVFCAFGVCKNQHHMYFMLDVHLDAVRFHMRLVAENQARSHVMAAKNELRKARNVIEGTVLPELGSLDEQLGRHGEDHVLERHPQLREIVRNRETITEEVSSWLRMEIGD